MGSKIAFLDGDGTATGTLQRVTERIDGGNVVEISSRSLPPHPTYTDFYATIKEIQTEIFATGIRKLRDSEFEPWEPDELGAYHSHRRMEEDPGFVVRYLLTNNWRRLRRRLPPFSRPAPTN